MTNKKRKLSGVFRTILLILCGLIVGVNVYLANASRFAGNQLPMPFGYGMAMVLSGSMEPTLSVNDVIIVRGCDTYAVDDIVVFQENHSLVVHRVISVDGDMVQTQGDANNSPDAPISKANVKGKVVLTIPALGVAVEIIRSPVGTVVILALAAWLMIGSYRKQRVADDEKKEAIKAEIRRLKDADVSLRGDSGSEVDADETE